MSKRELVLMTAALSLLSIPTTIVIAGDHDPIPGLIGVRVSPGVQLASTAPTGDSRFDSLNTALSLASTERVFPPKIGEDSIYDRLRLGDYYTLHFDSEALSPESLVQYYRTVPQIDLAYALYPRMLCDEYLPCDDEFSGQWGLRNTGQGGGTYGIDIGAASAWDEFRGSWNDENNAIIAVIDVGVHTWHPDLRTLYGTGGTLRDNFAWNEAELEGSPYVDDDGNGYLNDTLGWDMGGWGVGDDADVSPPGGAGGSLFWAHGTCVSTIAAAEADTLPGHQQCEQLSGMAGVAWYSRILPIKVSLSLDSGFARDALNDAVYYAVRRGADIINCSYSGSVPDSAEEAAFAYAAAYGVAVFAASGNENYSQVSYPAGYSQVFAVGAVLNSGERAGFSNHGDSLDAVAPGVDIVAGGNMQYMWYEYFSGTSASTPMAAGIAALLKSRYPDLSNDDLYQIMRYSSRDTTGDPYEDTPGWDPYHGWGLLNADRAIHMIMSIVNESPDDGSWVTARPVFTWRYVPVVNTYHVQIAYDTAFSQLVVSDSTVHYATWQPSSDLPEGTLYWRVRYQVPAGWQPFTNYTSIRVDNAEPDIPDLLSPGDDCFYTDSASPGVASFYWSTVESYSPIHYGLEYSTDSTFATGGRGDSTLVDTVWTDSTFTGNYWWYWHVKATDSSGNTSGWPAIPNRAVIAAMVGDVNASHTITSADIISLTNYVFKAGPEPVPHPLVGNTDECYGPAYSCFVSAADIVVLVQYVFYGQKKPCGLPCPEGCAHD